MYNWLLKFLIRFKLPSFRVFHHLMKNGKLKSKNVFVIPELGNFLVFKENNYISDSVAFLGDYESDEKRIFSVLIKKGFTVLDIGANSGFHTIYFSELVGQEGKVFCFEPVLNNYKRIVRNLELNCCKNVHAVQKGLSDKSETIGISAPHNANNPGAFNLYDRNEPTENVEVITGDSFIDEFGVDKVDFIKMDVEGYEYFAFKGLLTTLKRSKCKIVFEFDSNYHAKACSDPKAIFTLLIDIGYRLFGVEKNGLSAFNYEDYTPPFSLSLVAIHSENL